MKKNEEEENETPLKVESDFAEAILPKRQKRGDDSNYFNFCFLLPISNILFSFFTVACDSIVAIIGIKFG